MNRRGFTLIEVLLALFITAILITILSVVFNTGLRSYRQGKDILEIARKGQLILGQMTRELVGAIVQKDYIPFKGTRDSVYFMAPISDNSGKIDLCEIGYLRDGDELKRYFNAISGSQSEYPYADVDYSKGRKDTFCPDVKKFNLMYCTVDNNWVDEWDSTEELPELVEITVEISGMYPKDNPQSRTFTTRVYLPNSTNNP